MMRILGAKSGTLAGGTLVAIGESIRAKSTDGAS